MSKYFDFRWFFAFCAGAGFIVVLDQFGFICAMIESIITAELYILLTTKGVTYVSRTKENITKAIFKDDYKK